MFGVWRGGWSRPVGVGEIARRGKHSPSPTGHVSCPLAILNCRRRQDLEKSAEVGPHLYGQICHLPANRIRRRGDFVGAGAGRMRESPGPRVPMDASVFLPALRLARLLCTGDYTRSSRSGGTALGGWCRTERLLRDPGRCKTDLRILHWCRAATATFYPTTPQARRSRLETHWRPLRDLVD